MKMALTTKYGLYAWKNVHDFSLDNHLINSPCSYRGRPITDLNIQVLWQFNNNSNNNNNNNTDIANEMVFIGFRE